MAARGAYAQDGGDTEEDEAPYGAALAAHRRATPQRYSDEEEEEDDDDLPRPALPVGGGLLSPEALREPPRDGFDYLRRVRHEASALPQVLEAQRPARQPGPADSYGEGDDTAVDACLPPPPGLAPRRSWESDFLAQFADLRQRLAAREGKGAPAGAADRLPPVRDEGAWRRLCGWARPHGGAEAPALPSAAAFLRLSQVELRALVALHARWLDRAWEEEAGFPLCAQRPHWLFAVLARLDAHVPADTAAHLRHLFRVLSRVRARMTASQAPSVEAACVGVLATAVGRYFGQASPDELGEAWG